MSEGVTLGKHAALAVPDVRACLEACGWDRARGEARWVELVRRRAELIAAAEHDPLTCGWEPGKWWLCDALLALPVQRPWWAELHGESWEAWAERARARLGFGRPVKSLLILGGHRAGKTEYAAKRTSELMHIIPEAIVWPMHQNGKMSIEYHHKLHYKYLPPKLRAGADLKTRTAYISYKQKTGFSDHKFVLPNGSECSYRFYEMDRDRAIEGGEPNMAWCDELVPPDWVQTLQYRTATRDGWVVVTFTPVRGHSATVQLFMDGATVALEEPGFLLPIDGGEPDVARALGFRDEHEMREQQRHGRWSISWDAFEWLERGSGLPEAPAGRRFERVPLVARCAREDMAVVWFHSSDNPFGKPHNVARKAMAEQSLANRKVRYYGVTDRALSAMFAKFDTRVHVVADEEVPTEGTNYMVIDPAGGRNWFMAWLRVTRAGRRYVYREWPGSYEIPGIGVPGLWAEPDGKHPDGKRGPAQQPFGFGLMDYVAELARLEGWRDGWRDRVRANLEVAGDDLDEVCRQRFEAEARGATFLASVATGAAAAASAPDEGARERIERRFIDSRAAQVASTENKRPVTLQERLEAYGLEVELTPGDSVAEGVTMINSALAYDGEKPLAEEENEPALYVAAGCRNMIFALRTWTGADGQKGACKDPVDGLRYLLLAGVEFVDAELAQVVRLSGGYL